MQLEEKLRTAARQALADAVMELWLLPAPLCTEDASAGTWSPESPGGPGETVLQVRAQGESGEMRQRLHLKYTFIAVPHLPCASKVTHVIEMRVCSWPLA